MIIQDIHKQGSLNIHPDSAIALDECIEMIDFTILSEISSNLMPDLI